MNREPRVEEAEEEKEEEEEELRGGKRDFKRCGKVVTRLGNDFGFHFHFLFLFLHIFQLLFSALDFCVCQRLRKLLELRRTGQTITPRLGHYKLSKDNIAQICRTVPP